MGFKILLTENVSPVGAALSKSLENHPYPVVCPNFDSQFWSDEARVSELLLSTDPALVISPLHCFAGQAIVDHPGTYDVLARLCQTSDLTVIHLSSSLVFGCSQQSNQGAASESLLPIPDTRHGDALLSAEGAFLNLRRSIVLRLPWLLDSHLGMINAMCQALTSREVVIVSEHWRVAPVYVGDVARTVIAMVQQIFCGAENWGVYHLNSSDACSEAEFADCIARNLTKLNVTVAPIAVTGAGQEHFFPANGWLQGVRCTNDFGIQKRSWRKGVKTKVQAWVKAEAIAGRLAIQNMGDRED